jgi:hypothetical protein
MAALPACSLFAVLKYQRRYYIMGVMDAKRGFRFERNRRLEVALYVKALQYGDFVQTGPVYRDIASAIDGCDAYGMPTWYYEPGKQRVRLRDLGDPNVDAALVRLEATLARMLGGSGVEGVECVGAGVWGGAGELRGGVSRGRRVGAGDGVGVGDSTNEEV